MIVDALLNLFYGMLQPVVDALPIGSLPLPAAESVRKFGALVDSIDEYLPIKGPFQALLTLIATVLPAFLVYKLLLWIFGKVRGGQ